MVCPGWYVPLTGAGDAVTLSNTIHWELDTFDIKSNDSIRQIIILIFINISKVSPIKNITERRCFFSDSIKERLKIISRCIVSDPFFTYYPI